MSALEKTSRQPARADRYSALNRSAAETLPSTARTQITSNNGSVRALDLTGSVLIEAAGPSHDEMTHLVDLYQDAVDLDDVTAATALMTRINDFVESDASGGAIARIIRRAQAYESDIDLTLGSEARHFARELPRYRDQPELQTKRLWFDAVKLVMGRKDAEIFRVPAGTESINVQISGQEAIQRIRQEGTLKRQQEKAALEAAGLYKSYFLRTRDWEIGKERPLLDVKDGKIQPRGTQN